MDITNAETIDEYLEIVAEQLSSDYRKQIANQLSAAFQKKCIPMRVKMALSRGLVESVGEHAVESIMLYMCMEAVSSNLPATLDDCNEIRDKCLEVENSLCMDCARRVLPKGTSADELENTAERLNMLVRRATFGIFGNLIPKDSAAYGYVLQERRKANEILEHIMEDDRLLSWLESIEAGPAGYQEWQLAEQQERTGPVM